MPKRIAAVALVVLLGFLASFGLVDKTHAQVSGGVGWTGEYFSNVAFSGAPFTSRAEAGPIQFAFGAGAPLSGFPVSNNYSIRWSSLQTFAAGTYTFTAFGEDDVRVRVNGIEIIPFRLQDINSPQTFQATAIVPAGSIPIVVEYVKYTGNGSIQFFWQLSGPGGTVGPTNTPTRTSLPPIPPGSLTATVIRASVLNVRDAPSLGGNRLGRILRGETYAVVGRDQNARWFLLQLGGYQAWAWGYYLFINGNEFNAPVRSPFGTIGVPPGVVDTGVVAQAQSTMRLRAQPHVAAVQTGRIVWGAFLPVIGRTADGYWWQVVWKGTVGWMYSPFSKIIQGDLNAVPVK